VTAEPVRSGFWTGFVRLWLTVALAAVLAVAAWLGWADPYRLWRRDAPDRGGATLDLAQRFVKPLALADFAPDTVLIGSSRSYLGIDPRDVLMPPGSRTYGFGISSLSLAEIDAVVALALRAGARRLVIGLDEYMFDRVGTPPAVALDATMAEPAWYWRARLRSLLSGDALRASRALLTEAPREPGTWRPDGFKAIPPRGADATVRLFAGERFADRPILPDRLVLLDGLLDRLAAAGVSAMLYIGPLSAPMRARLEEDGRWPDYERLRARIAASAARHALPLADLATGHPFAAYDPARGSSEAWFDHHHFTPRVGRWILWRLGLRPRPD